jgi:hypothetical protein
VRLLIVVHRTSRPAWAREKGQTELAAAPLPDPAAILPARLPCPALPLPAEINTAFELLHSGKCLRCVLNFAK